MEFAVKHWQNTLQILAEIKAYRMPPDNMLRIVVALLVSVQSEGLSEFLGEDLLGTNKRLARSYPPKDDPQWTQKLWRYCKNNLHIQGHHPRYIIRLMKATAKGFDAMDISMVKEMRTLKDALEVREKESRSPGRRPTKTDETILYWAPRRLRPLPAALSYARIRERLWHDVGRHLRRPPLHTHRVSHSLCSTTPPPLPSPPPRIPGHAARRALRES